MSTHTFQGITGYPKHNTYRWYNQPITKPDEEISIDGIPSKKLITDIKKYNSGGRHGRAPMTLQVERFLELKENGEPLISFIDVHPTFKDTLAHNNISKEQLIKQFLNSDTDWRNCGINNCDTVYYAVNKFCSIYSGCTKETCPIKEKTLQEKINWIEGK